jgi:hypothetical protein
MIHKVKDLSRDQRLAIESLLGRAIGENEEIRIVAGESPEPPDWLAKSWKSAQNQDLDQLSPEDIAAARRERRSAGR